MKHKLTARCFHLTTRAQSHTTFPRDLSMFYGFDKDDVEDGEEITVENHNPDLGDCAEEYAEQYFGDDSEGIDSALNVGGTYVGVVDPTTGRIKVFFVAMEATINYYPEPANGFDPEGYELKEEKDVPE
jgi:hypothetical protein